MTSNTSDELRKQIENVLDKYDDWCETIYSIGKTDLSKEYSQLTALDKIMQLIEAHCNRAVEEADRKTLETVAALLNGDDNQIDVVKNYVHNKLKLKQGGK